METPDLKDHLWILPLFEWLTKRVETTASEPHCGKKQRPSIPRVPKSMNPQKLDDQLKEFNVKGLRCLLSQYCSRPAIAARLSEKAKGELAGQLSLYKRGVLARVKNGDIRTELRVLRAERERMHKATQSAELTKRKLEQARGIIIHAELNAYEDSKVRAMLKKPSQTLCEESPAAVSADLFDDLFSSSQESREDQSQKE